MWVHASNATGKAARCDACGELISGRETSLVCNRDVCNAYTIPLARTVPDEGLLYQLDDALTRFELVGNPMDMTWAPAPLRSWIAFAWLAGADASALQACVRQNLICVLHLRVFNPFAVPLMLSQWVPHAVQWCFRHASLAQGSVPFQANLKAPSQVDIGETRRIWRTRDRCVYCYRRRLWLKSPKRASDVCELSCICADTGLGVLWYHAAPSGADFDASSLPPPPSAVLALTPHSRMSQLLAIAPSHAAELVVYRSAESACFEEIPPVPEGMQISHAAVSPTSRRVPCVFLCSYGLEYGEANPQEFDKGQVRIACKWKADLLGDRVTGSRVISSALVFAAGNLGYLRKRVEA